MQTRMLWRAAIATALLCCLSPGSTSHAGSYSKCASFVADATHLEHPSATTVVELEGNSAPVGTWLKIVDAGSGTPSVAVTAWGPGGGTRAATRASRTLCTMNASTTYCTASGPEQAISFTVSGCTGTCSVRVSVCGVGAGTY